MPLKFSHEVVVEVLAFARFGIGSYGRPLDVALNCHSQDSGSFLVARTSDSRVSVEDRPAS